MFSSGGSALASVAFADFMAGGAFDLGAVFGNNTLNRIAPISIAGGFDQLDIVMGGSGGIDPSGIVNVTSSPSRKPLMDSGSTVHTVPS